MNLHFQSNFELLRFTLSQYMDVVTVEGVFLVEHRTKRGTESRIECVDEIDPMEVRIIVDEKKG
jgi:ribosomal protein L24